MGSAFSTSAAELASNTSTGSERRRPYGNLACRRLDDQLACCLERRALNGALNRVLADSGKMLVQAIRIPRDRGLVRVTIGIGHGNLLGQLPRHGIGLGIALNRDLRHLGNLVDRRRGGDNDLDRQVAVHRNALGDDAVAVHGGSGRDLSPCDLGLRRRLAVFHKDRRLDALERLAHGVGRCALGNANARDRLNRRRNLGIALHDRNRALCLLIGTGNLALDRDLALLGKVLVGETLGVLLHVDIGLGIIRVNRRDRSRQPGQNVVRLGAAHDHNVFSDIDVDNMRRHLDLNLYGHAVVR